MRPLMNREKLRILRGAVAVILVPALRPGAGEEIDEDALFGDTSIMVETERLTEENPVVDEREEKSVGLSGRVTASSGAHLSRAWFAGADEDVGWDNTSLAAAVLTGLEGDIRLPHSVKSYVTADMVYRSPDDSATVHLREMFLDFNADYAVFVRVGKQILQWGRGYFFNPVDLVNVEKTRFFDELTGREGAMGIKAHAPFGTRVNLYSFVDLGRVSRLDSVAGAVKAELLVGATECAVSLWGRQGEDPVYGFDFSSRLGNFSILGEAALHQGIDTFSVVQSESGPLVRRESAAWAPRVSLGAGRWLDFGNISDRIMVNVEGYYNHVGKDMRDLSSFLPPDFDPQDPAQIEELLSYVPAEALALNTISRWYAATFVTIARFVVTDMSFSASLLYNINQRCAQLTGGLHYATLHDLSFDLLINGFAGGDYTEYTLWGRALSVETRAGIVF